MKRVSASISVAAPEGVPRAIRRGGRTYRVLEVLDEWVARTRWWSKEEERTYYELLTDRGVIEVYRRGREWHLARLQD